MQSGMGAAPPCASVHVQVGLMQSPACKHLCMRLLNVRTLASAHNPEGWCQHQQCSAGGEKPADAGNKRAWFPKRQTEC
jgi:hypothetical protein